MALPRVVIEGRVVFEPELRFSPSGAAVLKLRLVSSDRRQKDDGTWEDTRTLWLDATAFRDTAEVMAEKVEKGDVVVVTGKLSTDEWETDSGDKRQKTVMIIDSWFKFPARGRSGGGAAAAPVAEPPAAVDEPPF